MRAQAVEIAWHDESTVWSVDCAPSGRRIVTSGADKFARIWRVTENLYAALTPSAIPPATLSATIDDVPAPKHQLNRKMPAPAPLVEWMCDLTAHTTTVNVARFAPDGVRIATGADQGEIVVWSLAGSSEESAGITDQTPSAGGADKPRERWVSSHIFRGHSADILDVSWSADGCRLASASVDNTIRVWDPTNPRRQLAILRHDGSLIQGVAFDPVNRYIASLRSDRTLVVYTATKYKQCGLSLASAEEPKSHYFASDIKCNTVFRRLAWSPDGSCLACPSGMQVPATEKPTLFAVHIYARGHWNAPVLQCSGLKKLPTSVAFCPVLFALRQPVVVEGKDISERLTGDDRTEEVAHPVFCLPYRMLFAVACPDSVLIYDTESCSRPVARVAGVHYSEITDVSWSSDASYLTVSSTDSSVSVIAFEKGELGEILPAENVPQWMQGSAANYEPAANSFAATAHTDALTASQGPTSAFEPVTPATITVLPRRKTTDSFAVGNSNSTLPTLAESPLAGSADCRRTIVREPVDVSGVRELVIVVPRDKQSSEIVDLHVSLRSRDHARKRLRMDEEV
jgi:chromatin assembly factor 1 subunit B